jgi:hypothetical protein
LEWTKEKGKNPKKFTEPFYDLEAPRSRAKYSRCTLKFAKATAEAIF